jgi:2-methoxy-6-polyprenyl-1,4-benzoquinol methylase
MHKVIKRCYSTTHFGFKTVEKNAKESMVRQVFESVAPQYDRMNDFMSLGIHRCWKETFINRISPTPNMKLLDVAGGTGDVSFQFVEQVKKEYGQKVDDNVTVFDINPEMLKVGKQRAINRGLTKLSFVEGNAEKLPFEDNQFDCYTIAFGIRNCTNVDVVLKEAYRVLKPGGRFACLEFSHVTNPLLKQAYDLHSFYIIPTLGEVVAKDRDSYQYLVESIRKFPPQEEFAAMIREAGFETIDDGYENLTFGVAAIHSGFKLE